MKSRHSKSLPPVQGIDSAVAPAAHRASLDHLRHWMHEGLHGLRPDGPVLAIGCEEAFLTPQLAEYSSDVTVLDTSAAQIGQLARRFPEISFLQHNPANPLPFAHDTFEAIWCCEFLDRIFDPAAVLREMHRVLAPGGRLLVTVPDHGAVRNVLIALFKWDDHFAPSNPRIRHFTRRTLVKLALEAGFEGIHTATSGAVRPIAGDLVPRSLLLKANKGTVAARARTGATTRAADAKVADELTLASHLRAA